MPRFDGLAMTGGPDTIGRLPDAVGIALGAPELVGSGGGAALDTIAKVMSFTFEAAIQSPMPCFQIRLVGWICPCAASSRNSEAVTGPSLSLPLL